MASSLIEARTGQQRDQDDEREDPSAKTEQERKFGKGARRTISGVAHPHGERHQKQQHDQQ